MVLNSMKRIVRLAWSLLAGLLLSMPVSQSVMAEEDHTWNTWSHNGSVVYLEWNGRSRKIYFLEPDDDLLEKDVDEGTLLFSGERFDFNYSGTAYVFSTCGPIGYEVTGTLSPELNRIRLYGKAPVVDGSCNVTSHRDEVLDFHAVDDGNCGCQCPGEIPVADIDEYFSSGGGTSCPYLYAWSEREKGWRGYGKVLHVAQGRQRETTETIALKELSLRFRLAEEEPETSFVDKVELRIQTWGGEIYALKPNLRRLRSRDAQYIKIAAYKEIDFRFDLPAWVRPYDVQSARIVITGYYEPIGSARPTQCHATRLADLGMK